MDAQERATQTWTRLFVETAQSERQRREQHTADIQRSIQQYTAAAEHKIRAALGPEATTLLPSCTATPAVAAPAAPASRPMAKAR
ncbi:hypothetical protein C8A01DRAFT_14330 [Parachaetomium inaequale]|uniref:Uncharacterized protein n=1 Tax=Parachaetomium inaequale TaxID=2588326 RepID=A0AAN6PJE3_9PEZI|nr:hypothetical protein C8A01DRAFT_14330 [Parachaetomium inaequale]